MVLISAIGWQVQDEDEIQEAKEESENLNLKRKVIIYFIYMYPPFNVSS